MAHLIDKDAVLAEIEKMNKEVGDDEYWHGYGMALFELSCTIDSMQEEPKFNVGDTIRYLEDGDIRTIVEVREDHYKLDDSSVLHFGAQDKWELVEESVSNDLMEELERYKKENKIKYEEDIDPPLFAQHFADWQKQRDNIPQELVDAYWEFQKVANKNVRNYINIVNGYNKEPVSEDLEKASIKYAQDKYMPVQTAQAFKTGAQWDKQQMMKDAVDGLVYAKMTNGEIMVRSNYFQSYKLEYLDKVKLIIIKEN